MYQTRHSPSYSFLTYLTQRPLTTYDFLSSSHITWKSMQLPEINPFYTLHSQMLDAGEYGPRTANAQPRQFHHIMAAFCHKRTYTIWTSSASTQSSFRAPNAPRSSSQLHAQCHAEPPASGSATKTVVWKNLLRSHQQQQIAQTQILEYLRNRSFHLVGGNQFLFLLGRAIVNDTICLRMVLIL